MFTWIAHTQIVYVSVNFTARIGFPSFGLLSPYFRAQYNNTGRAQQWMYWCSTYSAFTTPQPCLQSFSFLMQQGSDYSIIAAPNTYPYSPVCPRYCAPQWSMTLFFNATSIYGGGNAVETPLVLHPQQAHPKLTETIKCAQWKTLLGMC